MYNLCIVFRKCKNSVKLRQVKALIGFLPNELSTLDSSGEKYIGKEAVIAELRKIYSAHDIA